ncbi:hypothetical protein [Paenibacillus tyrfis]|uniref:hypothetical protein n=1 Tax=Paenibacillus tyrfis TaxID=1501230 RepID=UPI0020A04292|nr:hypothetical protein [Paenibacillus tyrfis]MCP1306117.1 hypothetical protein [Paenibacillus tyrfis]
MKNLFRSILALMFVFTLIMPSSSIFAETDLDAKLKRMGTPEELISLWSPDLKKQILSKGLKYVTHGISGTRTNKTRKVLTVVATAKWLPRKMPFWRLTDPYGVAFDKDLFRIVDNSAYYEDRFRWWGESSFNTFQTGRNFTYATENGVGFNADLRGDEFVPPRNVEEQISSGLFRIESKATNYPRGSSSLTGTYYHIISANGTIGLTFYGIGVSFTGTASNDSRGATKSFNY